MEENGYSSTYNSNFYEEIEGYKIKSAKRSFSRTMLSLASYLLISTAVVYTAQILLILIFGLERAQAISQSTYYIWGMQIVAMYIIAFPLSYLVLKKLPLAKRTGSKMSLEEFVVTFFIAEGVMTVGAVISNYIVALLSALLGYEIENATSDIIMDTPVYIVVLVAVIIGPIFEELMFRKLMIDRLSVYGDRFAIIVSAVSFGLFHGNLSQLIYAVAIGFIFGYVYVKTQNVIYSILLHILLNFFGTVPALLSAKSYENLESFLEAEEFNMLEMMENFDDVMTVAGVTVLQYALAIIGLVFLGYVIKRGLINPRNERDVYIERGKLVGTLFSNVGTIIFLVLCAIEIVISLLPTTL